MTTRRKSGAKATKRPRRRGVRRKPAKRRRARAAKRTARAAPRRVKAPAPAQEKVVVTCSVSGGAQAGAVLNGKPLRFRRGVASALVPQGRTNTLSWAVLGPPGAAYSIEVTEPAGTGCCVKDLQLDASGKDGGTWRFDT